MATGAAGAAAAAAVPVISATAGGVDRGEAASLEAGAETAGVTASVAAGARAAGVADSVDAGKAAVSSVATGSVGAVDAIPEAEAAGTEAAGTEAAGTEAAADALTAKGESAEAAGAAGSAGVAAADGRDTAKGDEAELAAGETSNGEAAVEAGASPEAGPTSTLPRDTAGGGVTGLTTEANGLTGSVFASAAGLTASAKGLDDIASLNGFTCATPESANGLPDFCAISANGFELVEAGATAGIDEFSVKPGADDAAGVAPPTPVADESAAADGLTNGLTASVLAAAAGVDDGAPKANGFALGADSAAGLAKGEPLEGPWVLNGSAALAEDSDELKGESESRMLDPGRFPSSDSAEAGEDATANGDNGSAGAGVAG